MPKNPESFQRKLFKPELRPGLRYNNSEEIVDDEGNVYDREGKIKRAAPSDLFKKAHAWTMKTFPHLDQKDRRFDELRDTHIRALLQREDKKLKKEKRKRSMPEGE